MKIYSLVDATVTIDEDAARAFSERERLYPSDFAIRELAVWDHVLSADEVLDAYAEHFEPVAADLEETVLGPFRSRIRIDELSIAPDRSHPILTQFSRASLLEEDIVSVVELRIEPYRLPHARDGAVEQSVVLRHGGLPPPAVAVTRVGRGPRAS